MTCLVRTDFNFVFSCVGLYFILTRYQDKDLFSLVFNYLYRYIKEIFSYYSLTLYGFAL